MKRRKERIDVFQCKYIIQGKMRKRKFIKRGAALLLSVALVLPSLGVQAAEAGKTEGLADEIVQQKNETEEKEDEKKQDSEKQVSESTKQNGNQEHINEKRTEVSAVSEKEERSGEQQENLPKADEQEKAKADTQEKAGVAYRSHIQDTAWEKQWKTDGAVSGRTGEAKRLEAIQIKFTNKPYEGNLEYRTHIQDYGWETQWKTDGEVSGRTGEAKRLEAIQIRLTGMMADKFDIYYRVHAQNYGWLDWTANGGEAGTEGYAYRLEAIEICLVEKGGEAPGKTEKAFEKSHVRYQSHVADIGWQALVPEGQTSGTTGKNRAVQAMKIRLDKPEYNGSIEYQSYVQDRGWQEKWKKDGEITGTTGKNLRLEAVAVRLTGTMAEKFDIYYRTHVSNLGWLGWAKNGEAAGTSGRGLGIEAVEIRLVEKGKKAPGATEEHYLASEWATDYTQDKETTIVSVKPRELEKIRKEKKADSLEVTAVMEYNGKITRKVTAERSIQSISDSGFRVDLKTYGKFRVTAQYKKNGKVVGKEENRTAVGASEYNLAPLSATFPVVYFSLSLWDVGISAETGKTVPTIVMLDRPSAYNWQNLPSGVYGMPYLTEQAVSKSSDYYAYGQYIKDLYEISPNAKFHLYINDITCSLIHWYIYANKIPEGQYTITMLSDGSATYSIMNDTYDVTNPEAKHQELIRTWEKGKKEAYETGKYGSDWGFHKHWDCMYAVLSCEPGTEWWAARNNLFTSGDGNVFAEKMKNDVKAVNVNTLLQALAQKGEAVTQAFKNLYNFNDGYFAEAEAQEKKAMMLLGTYVYNEKNFRDYARLTKLYYGEDYLYYYKGHPNTPTGLWPSKQQELNELGIVDVDSAIAAELILFFNPELSLSGYGSSTFTSASKEMACGLFNMTKDSALQEGSTIDYSGIDWFASNIEKESADPEIAALCPEGGTYYLVELSDDILAQGKYDIGIFDAAKGVLKFYKKEDDGTYKETAAKKESGNVIYKTHVADIGWQAPVTDGKMAGTTGKSKAVEALTVQLGALDYAGGVEYRAHVADIGWQAPVTDGKMAGTTGRAKAVEAISVKLTGEAAKYYDIYYQTHVKNFGWLDWAKNGENAGTQGYAYQIEAIRMKLVEKGEKAPGNTDEPFKKTKIKYQSHVANIGWQSWVKDGETAGTTGKKLALEALNIRLDAPEYSGDLRYRAHVSNIGWKDYVTGGETAGTTGQNRSVEAVGIKLTGEMEKHYDIYYRAHAQDYGWLGWAKNGEAAGTTGLGKRMEAIEIRLIPKGEKAPGNTGKPYVKK